MKVRRARALVVVALFTSVLATIAGRAPAAQAWAPADRASIHPGVQTVTRGAQCTANFVFTFYERVFLGQAAHCAGKGGATDTNGCLTKSHAIGTLVDIQGASRPGKLHYSSWVTMDMVGETNPDICQYNDFALVEVDAADRAKVNPSIPFWGGPTAQNFDGTPALSEVYSYGNSGLRLGLKALSPKVGTSLGTFADGWAHHVYTATPGIPGDSGSALLDSRGRATGVAATISPIGSNNFTDVARAVWYAGYHAQVYVAVVLGTARFRDAL